MNTPTLVLAGCALAAGLTAPLDDEEVAAAPVKPHTYAPLGVSLEITEDTWLRVPGEDWFAARAETEPGRFEYVDELVEVDGDFEGGWRDSQGEYEFRYDEEEDEFAYWQHVSAEVLTRGRRDFVQFCASCHGLEGDGYGRSAQHLRPPPRSFHQANFKFTKVPSSQLPSDDSLVALVKRGLDGTPMLPWALSDEQLGEILQYIKSLSPPNIGWRDVYSEIGEVIEAGTDPWAGRETEAITQGERIYHGQARCHSCHPGYVTPATLNEITGAAAGTAARENLSYPVLKEDSSYEVLGYPVKIFPPDFTWHTLRAGTSVPELFQTIGSGIGGTAMPQWKGGLADEDIWAMAHYVSHLIDTYKDKPERAEFMAGLRGR